MIPFYKTCFELDGTPYTTKKKPVIFITGFLHLKSLSHYLSGNA